MNHSKTQVIKCKCGKIFAACHVPECYTERDWLKDIRKYAEKGHEIDIMEHGTWKFEECVCEKTPSKQKDKNQTQLFDSNGN